jgi:hypothetical protein
VLVTIGRDSEEWSSDGDDVQDTAGVKSCLVDCIDGNHVEF